MNLKQIEEKIATRMALKVYMHLEEELSILRPNGSSNHGRDNLRQIFIGFANYQESNENTSEETFDKLKERDPKMHAYAVEAINRTLEQFPITL